MTELRLFDTPGEPIAEIKTTGTTIKPFLNATSEVVDEAKLHVTTDGLSITAVDPANVYMGDITLPGSAFDTYELERETTVGINLTALTSLVRRARKNHSDELHLSIRERELTATVSRGYENHDVVSQGTMQLIDSDSIRQEPDMPELEWSVDMSVDATPFTDALSYAMGASDHVSMSVKGVNQHANALYLGGETDTREEAAAISDIDVEETAEAVFSKDYLRSLLGGVGEVSPESVRVQFGEEYPLKVDMENEETGLEVEYFVAPRIRSD